MKNVPRGLAANRGSAERDSHGAGLATPRREERKHIALLRMSDLGDKSANSPRPVAEELPKQMGLVTSWACVKPDAERVVVRAPAVSPCQRSSPRQQGLCQNPAICIILHLIITLSSIRNILIAFLTKPPPVRNTCSRGGCRASAVWWYTRIHRLFHFLCSI